jgi:putative hydrolase of the HAD superfamily
VAISGILFDLGKVLVDFDMTGCESTLAAHSRLDRAGLVAALWDSGWPYRYERGEVTADEFHRYLIDSVGLSMDFRSFMKCWTEVFDPTPILPDHVLPTLAALFPMTLVSNTNQAHAEFVRDNYNVFPFFQNLVLSYQVGALKPEPRIFEYAIEVAGHPPDRLLMIDDRPENVEAAASLGLHTHRFESFRGLRECMHDFGVDLLGDGADLVGGLD